MTAKEKYTSEVVPALKEEFGYANPMQVPKITKISLNVGLGAHYKDAKFMEVVENVLTRISGQKPVQRRARKAISNFKIREGNIIGMSVTLRGKRMYDFFEKFINITLPRVRDFQGINPRTVDKQGNISIGFKEYLAFPEIRSDEVEVMHGLQVSIATSANNRQEGLALLKHMGIPFKQEQK
jgi:large subunit ribosomal protein L5